MYWPHTGTAQAEAESHAPFKRYYSMSRAKLGRRQERTTAKGDAARSCILHLHNRYFAFFVMGFTEELKEIC